MRNFGLSLCLRGEKSNRFTAAAIPTTNVTRGSSAPTVNAIHEPNDIPAAQSGNPG
jgi:hypothetical protein